MDFTPEEYRARPGHAPDNIARDENGRIATTRELTEKQMMFVREYLASGGNRNYAAGIAGYSQPDAAAHQLLNNPRVRDALYNARELDIDELAGLGLRVVRQILLDEKAPYGVRASLATRMIDMRHDVKIKALDRLSEKRIDEMTVEELEVHSQQLDKALVNVGLMIDQQPDIPRTHTQSFVQHIDNQQQVSV